MVLVSKMGDFWEGIDWTGMGEGVYVLLEMGGERSGGLICWGS